MTSDADPTPRTGVHAIHSKRQVDEAVARPLTDEYWNWQLDLPRATAATFLDRDSLIEPEVENPALRDELLQRMQADQDIRNELIAQGVEKANEDVRARMKQIDADNQARLKAIVADHGWPTVKQIGREAVHAAFLLLQHASDTGFQKEMLPLVEKSYENGEFEGQSYALLFDRTRVREGKPQRYGTQARAVSEWKDQQPALMPIEDEEHVEERRAEAGLPPLALYLKLLKQTYFPESATSGVK